MWIVVLIALGLALAGGDLKGAAPGDTPSGGGEDAAEWVHHGIRFVYSPSTKMLNAFWNELPSIPEKNIGVSYSTDTVGSFPDQESAYAASLGWNPFSGPVVVEPAPEGGAGPGGPAKICQTVKHDGHFAICLYQQPGGKWGYKATDGGGVTVATSGGLASKVDAILSAWTMLLPFPTDVVNAPDTRHGVTLNPNGTIVHDPTPANQAAWTAKATAAWQIALNGGVEDPAGLVLAVLGSIWPEVNLLRLHPSGQKLSAVADRVAPFKNDAAAAVAQIFVAPAAIIPIPDGAQAPEPVAPVVQIQLGASAELLHHVKADGSQWWIVTETGSNLNASGTEMIPWATWGVWGPDVNVSGDPVADGTTTLRAGAITAAQTWIETH